jgi:hypothetical protein
MHSTSSSVCRSDTPHTQHRANLLPTSEDWTFRVKVISAATNLQDDLFRDAVKGLVRVCFPDGILEQLGQNVVEQHMHEENARIANIRRMSEVFQTEMVHRLIGMLVRYFDTPDQAALGTSEYAAGEDERVEFDDINVEKSPPPPRTGRRKKGDATMDTNSSVIRKGDIAPEINTVQRRQKDSKISSKWQWDIDSSDFTDDSIVETFPRTADLFAYHALPIIKRKLGA